MKVVYLDSSAIVKLVVDEAESAALRDFLAARATRLSCGLARVEVPRAVATLGSEACERAREIVAALDLIALDDRLLDAAGALRGELRSLDAIHVAAAREVGELLECLVTYDKRMAAAARALGLAVTVPV
ncbi:MAG TPA: type II toxin-antitoxin system VapC family toxin [Solirubrobacteraceae bacterium]